MFELLKNSQDLPCQALGICTTDPRSSALGELLLNEIRQIAFYVVKSREFGFEDNKITQDAIEALCVNFSIQNFSEEDYIDLYGSLVQQRNKIKGVYENFYKTNPTVYEPLEYYPEVHLKKSIAGMINEGAKSLGLKNNLIKNDNAKLFELINILVKHASINVDKIRLFEQNCNRWDFEILRLFNLTNFPSTRKEKLRRRIKEFVKISYEIQQKLNQIFEKNYGERQDAEVLVTPRRGKSVLVSGDNLKELEDILKAIGNRKINVYTHGDLLVAHTYPKFKQYKNLIGHFGQSNPSYDFTKFQGVVFTTKNHDQRIDGIYRGFLYSSDKLVPKGIAKVKGDNFEPLIKSALEHDGFLKSEKVKTISLKYSKKEIDEALKDTKEIAVFVGVSNKDALPFKLNDKTVVELSYPIESDLLFYFDKKGKKNKAKKYIFFSDCNLKTLNLALMLKTDKNKEFYLMMCPKYYINPCVIKGLKENFDINILD